MVRVELSHRHPRCRGIVGNFFLDMLAGFSTPSFRMATTSIEDLHVPRKQGINYYI